MAYAIKNLFENGNIEVKKSVGPFKIIEYVKDMSVTPDTAEKEYFCSKMNIKKKQLIVSLSKTKSNSAILQKGAMQWMVGNIKLTTGITGVGDFIGKTLQGKVTGEAAIKPVYAGTGVIATEPTYKYLSIFNLDSWDGAMVTDNGTFFAADGTVKISAKMRDTPSSILFGNEGLFSLKFSGSGYVVLETAIPPEEMILIQLENSSMKIDGALAIAWSESLKFTVEKAGETYIGSSQTGEGLVNVYRGTGNILICPVCDKQFSVGQELSDALIMKTADAINPQK